MTSELSIDIASGVMTLSMARGTSNVLTLSDLMGFRNAFQIAGSADSRVQVIVIRSLLPQMFSMGLDPAELLPKSTEGRWEHFDMLAQMTLAALQCGRPIVCVVNGPAMAGGAVLAALADTRIFHGQHGKFSFAETKVNLPVPKFIQNLITRATHTNSLLDIVICARSFDTPAALKCGFANYDYVTKSELEAILQDILGRVLRLNPQVIQASMLGINSEWIRETELFLASVSADTSDGHGGHQFKSFLTDNFFGKALRELVKKHPEG